MAGRRHKEVGERNGNQAVLVSARSEFLRQIGEADHRQQEHLIKLSPQYIGITFCKMRWEGE